MGGGGAATERKAAPLASEALTGAERRMPPAETGTTATGRLQTCVESSQSRSRTLLVSPPPALALGGTGRAVFIPCIGDEAVSVAGRARVSGVGACWSPMDRYEAEEPASPAGDAADENSEAGAARLLTAEAQLAYGGVAWKSLERYSSLSTDGESRPSNDFVADDGSGWEQGVEALLEFGLAFPRNLPPMDEVRKRSSMYEGPTDESNWVIPDRLLVGAYPAHKEDDLHEEQLTVLLKCGVTTFVCLQSEYSHHTSKCDEMRPYIHDAYQICKITTSKSMMCDPSSLSFLHLPINDCDTTDDDVVLRLAKGLCWRLVRGEVLYLHCWGGHGRTGTLVAVMLGMLYNISKAEALKRTQLYHDCRVCTLNVPSPQTFSQRMQVLRVLDKVEGRRIVETHFAEPNKSRYIASEFELPIFRNTPRSFGTRKNANCDNQKTDVLGPNCSSSLVLLRDERRCSKRRRIHASNNSQFARSIKPPTSGPEFAEPNRSRLEPSLTATASNALRKRGLKLLR